jgi:hypothetical protein
MPAYIIDETRFHAEGAVVDWGALARRLGVKAANPKALAPTVQLRWMLSAALGLPTEPFKVWSRLHVQAAVEKPLAIQKVQLIFFGGYTLVTWPQGSMSHVSVDVSAPAGGTVAAFAAAPMLSNVVATAALPNGVSTARLAAEIIDGLLVSPGVTVNAARGIGPGELSQTEGWQLIEIVGLPVRLSEWGGVGQHGTAQGLVGSFVDAPKAAVQRLTRGAPPVGWGAKIGGTVAAPVWKAPDFKDLVDEVNAELLPRLRAIVAAFPPNLHASRQVDIPLPPPENSAGDQMAVDGSTARVSPLATLLMGASSDPFLSLVLGFGTAYPPQTAASDQRMLDYMITAHWEKGLNGGSDPVDFAAIIPAPGPALPPPPPADLTADDLGDLRPLSTDGKWRASVRVSWDRPPDLALFRTASFGLARAGITPVEAAVALMEPRPSGGVRPLAINNAADPPDPEAWRLHAIDRELPINSNPGNRLVRYGAAVQDIYGQWTPWLAVNRSLAQPDLEQVRIVSATLRPTVPVSDSICPTTLAIEFLWDWRIRRPLSIRFVGRLFAAADHGSPPPPASLVLPAGLERSLGGAGAALVVTFAADTPSAPGTTIVGLDPTGETRVAFGAAQGSETRRYRLTLSGLSLNFALSPHIGLVLWARGQERIPPQRVSAWSTNPTVTSASDPRPPVVPVDHVTLASLPDASGESHARISWTPQPGAVGYFIYEAAETTILLAHGRAEPTPDLTLDDRLATLQTLFNTNSTRRSFTRLISTLLQGTSKDVTLPRGSTNIHLYLVLGVSAGQVESAWPTGPAAADSLIAIAAPRIMVPAPPMLEVDRFLDEAVTPPVFKARIRVTTRPGPRPKRIDLHRVRVDDAAKELDTMGPPIARIASSGGGWIVTQAVDDSGASFIQTVQGNDAPPGSWRRVWYRAAAWTEQDDTRGGLPGRSPASTAAWVVIPPPNPPSVSPLGVGGGAAPAEILLQWSSPAPLKKTPLGPHTITVRASVVGAPPGTAPLLSVDLPLASLGDSQPGAGSGAWIVSTAAGTTTYRAIIRRAAVTDAVKFSVRITDPLGRTGERLRTIGAGPVNPAPDLSDLVLKKLAGAPPPKFDLRFSSNVPLVAPLNGPYRVRVIAALRPPVFPPVPPPPLVIDLPVGSVPTRLPAGPRPPITIIRSGAGPKINYVVGAVGAIIGFTVRITAPDGRFVEKRQAVT